jgi:hypothetical protein
VPPDDTEPATAYLVKVDLVALAENLTLYLERKHDAIDAALWLTAAKRLPEELRLPHDWGKPHVEEPSPFRPTDVSRVFYVECDPAALLEPGEIVWVKTTVRRPFRGGMRPIRLGKGEGKG